MNKKRCFPGILAIVLTVTGCAAGPSVRDVSEVSINVPASSDFHPELINVADPGARPGRLAGQGARQGLQDCSDGQYPVLSILMAPLCAGMGAAAGAAVGAVVTATSTIPDEDERIAVNATRQAVSTVHWRDDFRHRLEADGAARGKSIAAFPAGRILTVSVDDLAWSITVGNRLEVRAEIVVMTGSGQDFAQKVFTVSTPARTAEYWASNGGTPLRDAMDGLFAAASDRVWSIVDE